MAPEGRPPAKKSLSFDAWKLQLRKECESTGKLVVLMQSETTPYRPCGKLASIQLSEPLLNSLHIPNPKRTKNSDSHPAWSTESVRCDDDLRLSHIHFLRGNQAICEWQCIPARLVGGR